jgi:hypothetical protein
MSLNLFIVSETLVITHPQNCFMVVFNLQGNDLLTEFFGFLASLKYLFK